MFCFLLLAVVQNLFCESTMFWSGSKGMRLKITTMLWGFWVPLILAHAEPPAGPSTLNHETGGGRHRRGASEAKGRQGSSRGGVHPTIFPGSISHPHLHVLKLDSHVSFKVSRNFWNGIVRSQRRRWRRWRRAVISLLIFWLTKCEWVPYSWLLPHETEAEDFIFFCMLGMGQYYDALLCICCRAL